MSIFIKTIILLNSLISTLAFADEPKVNVYIWSGIIPDTIIQQFEKETSIKVNLSTYENNEILYAKLKTNKNIGYDIIEPSSYYIDRMRRQHMLMQLDKTKLTYFHNLNPDFLNRVFDPKNTVSIPFIWGVTGIFINKKSYAANSITRWSTLWGEQYHDQLMLLDDPREVFAIALLTLGYSINDTNPEHIKQAYLKLKQLMPNIKLFNSDAVLSILIDEDATVGMVWNGDLFKASHENPNLHFIFPQDGFIIWVDNFAIPKNAPHPDNAYQFLNFITRPDIAKQIAIYNNYPTANTAAQKLLPASTRNNAIIYPSHDVLRHGQYQVDISDQALALYENYWEQLKMGG